MARTSFDLLNNCLAIHVIDSGKAQYTRLITWKNLTSNGYVAYVIQTIQSSDTERNAKRLICKVYLTLGLNKMRRET